MAVIDDKLTTIGGRKEFGACETNVLLSLTTGHSSGWKEIFPPMPTRRKYPAAITACTHLVVAGGNERTVYSRDVVEVLDTNTLQWFTARSLPRVAVYPQIVYPQVTLCGEHLYLSQAATVFSCSVKELLKPCELIPTISIDGDPVWTRLADIPVGYDASLVTVRGCVLAVGGCDGEFGEYPTAAIHCYDRATNSWHVSGQLPVPLWSVLTAVLPTHDVIVAGGFGDQERSYSTYITNM